MNSLAFAFAATYLCEALSRPRRKKRLRSARMQGPMELFSSRPPPAARRPGGDAFYRKYLVTSKQKKYRDGGC